MRSIIRCSLVLLLAGLIHTGLLAQDTRALQDSTAKAQPDSLKPQLDSTATARPTAVPPSSPSPTVKTTPRTSTVRTVERQTAPHAKQNAPRVKSNKPTSK